MRTNPGVCDAPATEAPHVPGGAGAARQALETLDELVGAVAAANAMLNSISAWRAELMEAVRTWSMQSAEILVNDPWAPRAQHTAHQAMVAELACALSLPEQTTSNLVDDAQILVETCPATLSALRQGTISYRHAQVVLEHTDGLDHAAREELEQRLLAQAPGTTASTFARRARKERERSHPIPLVERHAKALPKRCVELDAARDGMAWLHQYLPAAEATAIFNRVSDIAAASQHPSDPRTLPELRADAFSALMLDDAAHDAFRRASAAHGPVSADGPGVGPLDGIEAVDDSGAVDGPGPLDGPSPLSGASPLERGRLLRGIRPTVSVTVPVLTLLGLSDSPGTLEGYGPIDAETARILAGRAPSFRRILTHPETGAVLSVGRDHYAVPADLKAALRLRDETCRFPGCSRRARRCDIDHVTDWALGGTTDQENLMLVCRRHHRLKHLSTWRPRVVDGQAGRPPDDLAAPGGEAHALGPPSGPVDTSIEWTAPSGRTYTTDSTSRDEAPRLGFAFLLSLGLSADFLLRIGIVPSPDEAAAAVTGPRTGAGTGSGSGSGSNSGSDTGTGSGSGKGTAVTPQAGTERLTQDRTRGGESGFPDQPPF